MTNTLTPLRVEVKCFGKYTFRIADPALFMSKLAGTADIYKKDEMVQQIIKIVEIKLREEETRESTVNISQRHVVL